MADSVINVVLRG